MLFWVWISIFSYSIVTLPVIDFLSLLDRLTQRWKNNKYSRMTLPLTCMYYTQVELFQIGGIYDTWRWRWKPTLNKITVSLHQCCNVQRTRGSLNWFKKYTHTHEHIPTIELNVHTKRKCSNHKKMKRFGTCAQLTTPRLDYMILQFHNDLLTCGIIIRTSSFYMP